jgi:hypothetical protein
MTQSNSVHSFLQRLKGCVNNGHTFSGHYLDSKLSFICSKTYVYDFSHFTNYFQLSTRIFKYVSFLNWVNIPFTIWGLLLNQVESKKPKNKNHFNKIWFFGGMCLHMCGCMYVYVVCVVSNSTALYWGFLITYLSRQGS